MKSFIDTNIFVYASYTSFAQHESAKNFLRNCLRDRHIYTLSWNVIYEYLRVVTHPQIFPKDALSFELAVENVMNFCSADNVEILTEGENHFNQILDINKSTSTTIRGNFVHDAHSVSLMRENDIQIIYTCDTDYHRFREITVKNPLD